MNPINALKTTLTLVALLCVALAAHANPRGVESKDKELDADDLPLAIEISAPLLSAEHLDLASAPVISLDDIDVFAAPATAEDPDGLIIENPMPDQASAEAQQWNNSEDDWRNDAPDLSVDAPDLDLGHDDFEMPDVAPRIKIEMPAPEITLDF